MLQQNIARRYFYEFRRKRFDTTYALEYLHVTTRTEHVSKDKILTLPFTVFILCSYGSLNVMC